MFIFLNLIYSASNNINNTMLSTVIEEIQAKSNVIFNELLSIEKDFDLMERHFHRKLDTIILEKQKTIRVLYPEYFRRDAIRKKAIRKDQHNSLGLFLISKQPLLKEILSQLLFSDFFEFYDKYSYIINRKIEKIYETTFESFKEAATNMFSESEKIPLKSKIKKEFSKTVRYRSLHYFRILLEQKIVKKFFIDLNVINNVFYGCNFQNKAAKTEYIREYYNYIFDYRRSSSETNIDEFFENPSIKECHISQLNAIKASMIKQASYFNKNLSYDFEEDSQPKHYSCEDVNKSEQCKECNENGIKKLLPKQQSYHELAPPEELLKYCDYRRGRCNKYSRMLKEMNHFRKNWFY